MMKIEPGEEVIIGNNFPIPLTINIKKPNLESADFHKN